MLRRILPLLLPAVALLSKVKFLLIPLKLAKVTPLIGPSVSALISVGAYGLAFGWQFGIGIVGLIFVHEMGHVIMLRRYGVRATAPIFIPFLGAFIGMRQLPRDAVMEAYVGLGGPILGSVAAFGAWGLYQATEHPLWLGLAYLGVLLNLFNLLPILPLDGGRAVGAISRWMWVIGIVGLLAFLVWRPNPVLILIVILGGVEFFQLWRRRGRPDHYYQVPPHQRFAVSAIYFGLVALLAASFFELEAIINTIRPV